MFLILALDNKSYCFKFTWVSSKLNEGNNCSTKKGVPCFDPVTVSENPPNTSEIWDTKNRTTLCELTSDNSCITYTFQYNDNLVNTSLFCGKIMEDQTIAVTSGCYEQKVGAYTIEACACKSKRDGEPCNASPKTNYSVIPMIISLLFIFIKFNY